MRDLAKILCQEIDSLEFRAAWEESSMEYDFMDRIVTVCAQVARNAEKNNG